VLTAGGGAALLAAAITLVLLRPQTVPPVPPTSHVDIKDNGHEPPAVIPLAPPVRALEDEAALSTAREAIQVSTVYGRQSYRRTRQKEALPSLEHLAQIDTRYQKQLADVQRGLQNLDQDKVSLLHQYVGLIDQLVEHPDRFDRIKNKLFALDLPEVGKLARQQLIQHVEARERGPLDATALRDSLDRAYVSQDLWWRSPLAPK